MSSETYKGIEFVRISNLPEEQRTQLFQTLDNTKIIKILRNKELLNDCIQLSDYKAWVEEKFKPAIANTHPATKVLPKEMAKELRLVFK